MNLGLTRLKLFSRRPRPGLKNSKGLALGNIANAGKRVSPGIDNFPLLYYNFNIKPEKAILKPTKWRKNLSQ
jgi:hypothetical protein